MNAMEKLKRTQNNRRIGTYYEEVAKDYLIKQGYRILEMNYRTKFGEVDLIIQDQEYTIFVEIKYRKHILCGYPRENVHQKKQQVLIRVATQYLVSHNLYHTPVRFDVVEILGQEISHIPNAFMKG